MYDNLILENAGLIYSIAHTFSSYKDKEDLFQVGVIGIIKAQKNFDASRGVKFTTFAYSYIWGEINKYVKEDRGIKVSRDINKLNSRIEKTYSLLSQIYMKEPTMKEVADYLELPLEAIEEALLSSNPLISMDDSLTDDGKEMTLHDSISSPRSVDIDMLIALKGELCNLPKEDFDLINARYIMDMTQAGTAQSLGMTQVQVSRREEKVKSILRSRIS